MLRCIVSGEGSYISSSCFFCCLARILSNSELVRDLMVSLGPVSLEAGCGAATVTLLMEVVALVSCFLSPNFLSSLARVSDI
jgi:hypothetical protein